MRNLDMTTPEATAFLEETFGNATYQTVPMTRGMPVRLCYSNVRQVVASEGGEAVWGWALFSNPGHFIEAMHHAVWKNPAGEYEDVTARTSISSDDVTIFVPDEDVTPQAVDPRLPSKFRQLDSSENVRFWIEGNLERMRMMQELHEILMQLDHSILDDGSVTLREQPPAEFINLLNARQTLETELRRVDAEMCSGIYR